MSRLHFYFERSLMGYFCRRAKEKWFTKPPTKLEYHGVTLQLDGLPKGMQAELIAQNYEVAEMRILPALISSTDEVLEIGGAIGFVGLFCRKIAKVKNLVSVEPNPVTVTYLRRNYELNCVTPFIIEAAMTEVDGPTCFYVTDMFWSDSLMSPSDADKKRAITVEGLTFASLVRRAGVRFNTLIIDIEGGEQYLPIDSFPEYVNKVLIEIHPEVIGIRQAYNVVETLIRSGFRVEGHFGNSWALRRD